MLQPERLQDHVHDCGVGDCGLVLRFGAAGFVGWRLLVGKEQPLHTAGLHHADPQLTAIYGELPVRPIVISVPVESSALRRPPGEGDAAACPGR